MLDEAVASDTDHAKIESAQMIAAFERGAIMREIFEVACAEYAPIRERGL